MCPNNKEVVSRQASADQSVCLLLVISKYPFSLRQPCHGALNFDNRDPIPIPESILANPRKFKSLSVQFPSGSCCLNCTGLTGTLSSQNHQVRNTWCGTQCHQGHLLASCVCFGMRHCLIQSLVEGVLCPPPLPLYPLSCSYYGPSC